MKQHISPIPPSQADQTANKPDTRLDAPGIDYRESEQLALLNTFRAEQNRELFRTLRQDKVINKSGFGTDAVSNTYCNTPDAEIYGSMILGRKPNRIVEVGSGYSTLIARKTVSFAGYNSRIVVIDPHPRTDVRNSADELHLAPVEQTGLDKDKWSPDDILFIDSSHICRTRGDLPFLFCKVIPSLPPGMLVHVHDIFLPFDYPNLYDQWCHTEEYLLACMLSHSKRYRVVLATHWLSRVHAKEMNLTFGPFVGSHASSPHHLGCSFWLEVLPS